MRSGLRDALDTLEGIQGIGVVRLGTRDVVRHRWSRDRPMRMISALRRKATSGARPAGAANGEGTGK